MRTTSRIFINAVTGWLATLTNSIVGILVVPFLLGQLGKEGFGLISVVYSIVGFCMIADAGLSMALARQLAERLAKGDFKTYNELAGTALLIYVVVSCITAGVLFLSAPAIARAFNVTPKLIDQAIYLIRWFGGGMVALSFLSVTFRAVVTSQSRFDVANLSRACVSIMRGLLLFLVLGLTNAGIFGWAGVVFASELGLAVLLWRSALRVCPEFHLRLCFSVRQLRSLLSLSIYLFLLHLTNLFSTQSDPFVISWYLGVGAVALYSPALMIVGLVRPLVGTLTEQLHPVTTGLYATGETLKLQTVLIRGTRYTFLMGIGACVTLGIFAEPIVRIWLGAKLGQEYVVTAMVLGAWVIVDLATYAGGPLWPLLLGMNRLPYLVVTQIPLAAINLLASICIVAWTDLGVIGVMIPTVAIGLLRRPVDIVYCSRVCGMTSGRYFREAYLRPMIVLVTLTVLATVLLWLLSPMSLLSLIGCTGVIGLAWAGMCWQIGFAKEDRDSFRGLASMTIARFQRSLPARDEPKDPVHKDSSLDDPGKLKGTP